MERHKAYKVKFIKNRAVNAQPFCGCRVCNKAIQITTTETDSYIEWMVVYSLNEKDAVYMANCITEEFLADMIA